jgi:hypothetical protein
MDIVLSTEDLTVLGGPESVIVEVDYGATGDRGSQIFVNTGKPNSSLAPNSLVYDLYINILPSDDEYQYVYQLQNVLGENTWVKLYRLINNFFTKNYETPDFIDGVWTKAIPLAEVVAANQIGSISSSQLNIQYNILNQNPVSSSLTLGEINPDDQSIPITIKALEFNGTNWVNLDGSKTVHLFITVV